MTRPEFMLMKWIRVESPESLKMGLVTSKTKWLKACNFQAYPPSSKIQAGSWRLNSISKKSWTLNFRGLWGQWTHQGAGRVAPGKGFEAPQQPPTPYFALCISSIWLFLSCILYNKLVNVSKAFFWVLWVITLNCWTWEGGVGTTKLARYVGGPWDLKWGQACGTESFNLQDLMLPPGT